METMPHYQLTLTNQQPFTVQNSWLADVNLTLTTHQSPAIKTEKH